MQHLEESAVGISAVLTQLNGLNYKSKKAMLYACRKSISIWSKAKGKSIIIPTRYIFQTEQILVKVEV
jgi:hypothetical protein